MAKSKFIAIRNQTDSNTLELHFLDVIQDSFDWFSGMTYSKVQEIINQVNAYQPSKILCIIDSIGGDAQTGLSIYNYLKHSNAKVEVEVIGLAGSIASVVAMAANKGKLRMAKNAFMMIHKAEGGVLGTADEVRQGADIIQKYDDQIADIYSQRLGKPVDEIKALYANGDYWMTGEEAVAQGFADAIFNETINIQVAARLDIKDYTNIPEAIKAQLEPAEAEDDKTFIQTQFNEMKKFFTDLGTSIMNSVKGVKAPEANNHEALMGSIGTAISNSFEQASVNMETAVQEVVKTEIGSDTTKAAIVNEVTNAVNAIDFTKDGAHKTAIENAVKVAVDAATKDMADKITNLETANAQLTKTNGELVQDITNLKGKKTTAKDEEGSEVPAVGKWN